MRRPDLHGRGRNNPAHDTSLATWLPVIAAVAIMLTACLSTFLVLQLDAFRPKIGDIVAFQPGSQDPDMWQMTITADVVSATGAPRGTCALDPDVMAAHGGSLIVEGLMQDRSLRYRVHWAGSRTIDNAQSCGSAAELAVSRTDLQRLANAAGGFGVGDKGVAQ